MATIETIFVKNEMSQQEFYMTAVLYLLSGETANIKVTEEQPTYANEKYREQIRKAVPGNKSMLMDLAIKTKVSEALLDNSKMDIEEKVRLIASRIKEFVII